MVLRMKNSPDFKVLAADAEEARAEDVAAPELGVDDVESSVDEDEPPNSGFLCVKGLGTVVSVVG